MTNREKYAEEILDVVVTGSNFGFSRKREKVTECCKIDCLECAFNVNLQEGEDCCVKKEKWANSEYVEKPKLSKKDRMFLSLFRKNWNYMARNQDGALYAFDEKPRKFGKQWLPEVGEAAYLSSYAFDLNFPMIKWEDEEPWEIARFYGLEEVEEYENN